MELNVESFLYCLGLLNTDLSEEKKAGNCCICGDSTFYEISFDDYIYKCCRNPKCESMLLNVLLHEGTYGIGLLKKDVGKWNPLLNLFQLQIVLNTITAIGWNITCGCSGKEWVVSATKNMTVTKNDIAYIADTLGQALCRTCVSIFLREKMCIQFRGEKDEKDS